jgi:plastocyanin
MTTMPIDTPHRQRLLPSGAALAAVAALAFAGCGGGSGGGSSTAITAPSTNAPGTSGSDAAAGAQQSADVPIKGFKFVPATVKLKVGGTVTFTNDDSASHTATSDTAGVFDTNGLDKGQAKKVTFTKAGTFAYHCDFHPFMKGAIVVVR